jgi:hypothetical protein
VLVIFLGCGGISCQEFVPPGQAVNQHYYREVLQRLKRKSVENFRNDGRARTGWFVIKVPAQAGLSVRQLLAAKNIAGATTLFTPLMWLLMSFVIVSENEIEATRVPFAGCP